MNEGRITLGELRKKLELESFTRSSNCKIQVDLNDEVLYIVGDGLVSAIPLIRSHPAEKHWAERDFEKRMIKQLLFFNKMIDAEIKANGFIDKEKMGEILDKQVEYFKEISMGR